MHLTQSQPLPLDSKYSPYNKKPVSDSIRLFILCNQRQMPTNHQTTSISHKHHITLISDENATPKTKNADIDVRCTCTDCSQIWQNLLPRHNFRSSLGMVSISEKETQPSVATPLPAVIWCICRCANIPKSSSWTESGSSASCFPPIFASSARSIG